MLSAEDRVAIEALHEAWLAAELRGDSSACLSLCAADPVWLPPGEAPLLGRPAIVQWLADQPETAVLRIDIDQMAIDGVGSFASKMARFRTTVDGLAVVTGSHGWLLQRDDAGVWRILVVAWTLAGGDVRDPAIASQPDTVR